LKSSAGTRACCSPPPAGAVLVIGLAVIATASVLVIALAQSAIFTNDKTRSLALADASAKSVATWYAQILNYDAYSNRAIAANEIMMAQAVTLVAWTQYMQSLASNIGTVASVIPPLQSVAVWVRETALLSHQMARAGALAEVPLRSAYTRALQSSQQIMHASATPFGAQALVNEVIWTADSRFFGRIIPSTDISAFSGFSRNYSGADRRELADLVRRSQDSFSSQRASDQRLYLMPTTGCVPTSIDRAFGRLVRRGGTWFTNDYRDIEAADTLSIHTWRRRSRWNRTCGGTGEAIPLGWGAADASAASFGIRQDPVGIGANGGAFSNARSGTVRIPGYLGLSSSRELSQPLLQARQTASVRVPVLIRLPNEKVKNLAGVDSTNAREESLLSGQIWSLAVGETYFLRPQDTLTDNATREFANLFSPFWGARLVAPNAQDRAFALSLAQGWAK
jgi:hypothetical protein